MILFFSILSCFSVFSTDKHPGVKNSGGGYLSPREKVCYNRNSIGWYKNKPANLSGEEDSLYADTVEEKIY